MLMTAFALILGVVALVIATEPGAEKRQALGTIALFGVIGVRFLSHVSERARAIATARSCLLVPDGTQS